LELRMPIGECPTSYGARAEGSNSKLRTYGDGLRILRTIANLVRDERPLEFFTAIFATLAVLSVALGWPVVLEFLATGLVLRFPTALLSLGLMLLAFLSLACGLILDTVTRGRRELRRLAYLQVPAVASRRAVRRPTVLAG
ncbi:MAG: glycosyl transferase, partial [Candidatus Nanopelagicales bacterium]